MKAQMKLVSFFLGTVLVLGLPPVLLLTAGVDSDRPAEAAGQLETDDPVRTLLASRSTLETVFERWAERHEANGGDTDVLVGLGWARGLSTEFSTARGRAELDLIGGSLEVEVQGLGDDELDVWLVDNQPGEGMSVTPQTGDRFYHVGRLTVEDGVGRLQAEVGAGFFDEFELDLVVVSRAGERPADQRTLVGSRSFFQRLYTQTRQAAERAERQNRPALLASFVSLFQPARAEANSTQVLISHGLVSQQVGDGADLFFRGTFSGNGRTCGTCHRAEQNLGLDNDGINNLPNSDKLFIAEQDPNAGGVPGLERPVLMRNHGLILENVDGAEDPTVKFTMRGIPHSLSMSTSIVAPADGRAADQRTGWSGDGAPAPNTLRLFSAGAVFQHFTKSLQRVEGVDFVLPTDAQLDAMEAFMLASGRVNELDINALKLNEASAQNGIPLFIGAGKCNGCHGNAGAISPFTNANPNFDTGVETLFNPARNLETFPFDGGFGNAQPRDCDGDNVNDCFGDGTFNTPPLVEAADTPPFFHNNAIETVEGAVGFYAGPEFNNSPAGALVGGVALTAQEIDDIAAFLRVINAAFNLEIALQRNDAAASLENNSPCGGGGGPVAALRFGGASDLVATRSGEALDSAATGGGGGGCTESAPQSEDVNGKRATVNKLLELANAEGADAIAVLEARGLNPAAVDLIRKAIDTNQQAIFTNSSSTRKTLILNAKADFASAKADLGTGLDFVMGEANLLF